MTFGSAFSPESVGSLGLFFGLSIDSSIWIIRCPTSSTADHPLLAALAEIRDPRRPQGQRYSLRHLLLFSVLAILAGATSYQLDFAHFSVGLSINPEERV